MNEIFQKKYENRQWIKMLWISLPVITFVVLAIESGGQTAQQNMYSFSLLLLINVCVLLVIGSLKITVDELNLQWEFGFLGKPSWLLPLNEIIKFELCETSWVEGWGIRFTKEGMLYNASGKQAIRIFKKDGSVIRLGTNEPEKLMALLMKRVEGC